MTARVHRRRRAHRIPGRRQGIRAARTPRTGPEGQITLRRALAHSRNVAEYVKVAETVGFDRVAALWKRTGVGATAREQ